MLPDILPEVKLKVCYGGNGDFVLIVENLPKEFIYRTVKEKIPKLDREGDFTGELKVGKLDIEVPKEKITMDQTKNDFFLFEARNSESMGLYKAIIAYVERILPRSEIIPKAIPYSSMPGTPSAPPVSDTQIPRVVLPVSSPPSEEKPSVEAGAPVILPSAKKKRSLSPEGRKKLQQNAAKARAVKEYQQQ